MENLSWVTWASKRVRRQFEGKGSEGEAAWDLVARWTLAGQGELRAKRTHRTAIGAAIAGFLLGGLGCAHPGTGSGPESAEAGSGEHRVQVIAPAGGRASSATNSSSGRAAKGGSEAALAGHVSGPLAINQGQGASTDPQVAAPEQSVDLRWEAFQLAHSSDCVGDPEARALQPMRWSLGGWDYELQGGRARLRRKSLAKAHSGTASGASHTTGPDLRIGVISGIKEPDAQTPKVVEGFLEAFEAQGVELVLVGGDSGFNGRDLETVFRQLCSRDWPVLAIAGNNESRSRFNRALRSVSRAHPNLINMDLVRVVQAEHFGVVSLPGYHLKAFSSSSASCLHQEADIRALGPLIDGLQGERIVLLHGPPLQSGKRGIDYVDRETGNVGNEVLAKVLKLHPPQLLVAGHILESGTSATNARGARVAPGKASPTLFLNPGQASALPYQLSGGRIVHGTAAIVTLRAGTLRWRLLAGKAP